MDQEIRNKLRNVVTQCRKLLEDSVSQELEGKYGIFAKKDQVTADPSATMAHLTEEEQAARKDIVDHFGHIQARGFKPKEALDQLVREIAFTHLNRLCAYKMMEAREVYVGGQKFREAVSRGINSNGVKFYLADHPEEERLFNTGHQDVAYRHFLDWLGGLLSDEIGVLFNPNDSANRIYPRQKALNEVLDLLNSGGIKADETELREEWPKIWLQDETIGWVYQYFTPKELRDAARDPKVGGSQAPRNSYELSFRNQFFTPRYVVEFLTDNTLGRIWFEMRKGETKLKDQCRYFVRRPTEIFLKEGEQPPNVEGRDDLSQEELLKLPVHIPYRPKKDPRELKILDPACGSGHFLLYCFDLLLTIYEEAYSDPDLGPALQKDYPKFEDFRWDVPRLVLAHNLHGIDIDVRAGQIAALALWLRCQRAYQDMGLKKDRPTITRSNFICAEPMPGEEQMLKEFVGQLEPKFLGRVVEVVFDKMKLAGEAGSLLKIEEEVRSAVAAAKKQWGRETTQATDREGQPLLFTQAAMDRLAGKPEHPSLFDLTGITDDQFFEQAEAKVIESLRRYAEKAQNGQRLQRRLFAEDAVRGFAFVDLCRQRFDVVLMNPPFGEPSKPSKDYVGQAYPRTKNDVYAAFVERGLSLLRVSGRLGAITSRTGFFLSSFQKWREEVLLKEAPPTVFADLGYGVLDTALVETAAYCLETGQIGGETIFLRLLSHEDKAGGLASAVTSVPHTQKSSLVFLVSPSSLKGVPGAPFAYWIDGKVRSLFSRYRSLESPERQARRGASTGDDTRRVRCWWEVNPNQIGREKRWAPFAKGGAYSPYYADVYLVVGWDEKRRTFEGFYGRPGRMIERPEALDFFFRAGLTWPRRSTSGFGIRALPAGCVIADKGPAIFLSDGAELATLGILFSQSYQRLVELSLAAGEETQSGTAGRSYEVGLIQRLPWPELATADRVLLTEKVRSIILSTREADVVDETTKSFVRPVATCAATLHEAAQQWQRDREMSCVRALQKAAAVEEKVVERLFNGEPSPLPLTTGDARILCTLPDGETPEAFDQTYCRSIHETIREELDEEGGNRQIAVKSYYVSRHLEVLAQTLAIHPRKIAQVAAERHLLPEGLLGSVAESLVSYSLGCAFGRWDVRLASPTKLPPETPDPFAPVPVCSPGLLQGTDGLPAIRTPERYPLSINWDGILVDDSEHSDDVVHRVRNILELIWKDRADAIEGEVCNILGVKELRDYFRKPGKDGFWDGHISRYSKSRRKAPIYWFLQSSKSPKKNYGIWLYYHRLDKDLLFKALVNFVEPKIRFETSRLESFRSQKLAAGEGRQAKRLAKEVEYQEDFLSELRDFEDKLRRAANLHLEPDLNDGVVLNVAPLWELVPWKEPKNYWDELLKGEYEWSSIGKQLRQKGLVK